MNQVQAKLDGSQKVLLGFLAMSLGALLLAQSDAIADLVVRILAWTLGG